MHLSTGRSGSRWLDHDELGVLRVFLNAGVRFVIVGGRAVQFHGHPRVTKDLDLLIEASPENGRHLRSALKILGTQVTNPEQFESLSEAQRAKGSFCRYAVDYLTAINSVRFVEAWDDAIRVVADGLTVRVISKRHLVASKQNTGRSIDESDAVALNAVQ